jgi:hypothetical protein
MILDEKSCGTVVGGTGNVAEIILTTTALGEVSHESINSCNFDINLKLYAFQLSKGSKNGREGRIYNFVETQLKDN